jgi:hypothetical protein
MKKVVTAGIAGLFAIFFSGTVLADDLTITYTMPEVSVMLVMAEDNFTLTLVEPSAGNPFQKATSIFYVGFADNTGATKKITINTQLPVPTGLTLTAEAEEGYATPAPEVMVSNSPQDLITGISRLALMSTVTLGLTADMTAAITPGSTMTLTLTFADD